MHSFLVTNFDEVLPIWRHQLWPERKSKIEPISYINHNGEIDMDLEIGNPLFWCSQDTNGKILGVCSGFSTSKFHFRSRGLWVDPQYRGQGIAKNLISQIRRYAQSEGFQILWTLPRSSAWLFYKKQGFQLITTTDEYEYGPNMIAHLNLR